MDTDLNKEHGRESVFPAAADSVSFRFQSAFDSVPGLEGKGANVVATSQTEKIDEKAGDCCINATGFGTGADNGAQAT